MQKNDKTKTKINTVDKTKSGGGTHLEKNVRTSDDGKRKSEDNPSEQRAGEMGKN